MRSSVNGYDDKKAMLLLRDQFAHDETTTAFVNVDNITSTLDVTLTQVGAWINVVGYYKGQETYHEAGTTAAGDMGSGQASRIDAVMIWSAGAVKFAEYEAAVKAMQASNVHRV